MEDMEKIMDGKALSQKIRESLKEEAAELKKELGRPPGLVVFLVGDNEASKIYVRNKAKASEEVGINSVTKHLPKETSEEELLKMIDECNRDENVDGILVQLPLPEHINETRVIEAIDPSKDVDGFHPYNMGLLLEGRARLIACTPLGIMKLLEHYNVEIKGKNCVVVGRSNIVGKPAAILLMHSHGTVTICHSRTKDLPEKIAQADILVAAIGKPHYIKGEWIKEGSVVIDVGITRTPDGLKGDVEFERAKERASLITPVPGGVGPMTIAMLLSNTITAARMRLERYGRYSQKNPTF
jgi:methylenetetrahydrofolate dehydrogenase (NADP+)/methenyltetrahydrofolate cyclohydrolase